MAHKHTTQLAPLGRFIACVPWGTMLALALLLAQSVSFRPALAEQRELKNKNADKVDAVLVLDGSASMRVTDPERLRDEGSKLFIQFLKPGDRLAIIEFAETAQTIRPLSNYSRTQAEEISRQIAKVSNAGLYTNILLGVEAAFKLLKEKGRKDANKTIILLSDGKMDPNPRDGKADILSNQLIYGYLPELKEHGVLVHTLSFSEEADKALLESIAVGTDGMNWFTPTADRIHESFAELFLAVKKPQIVPLTGKGFRIDADVQEATFYINNEGAEQISVRSPAGEEYSAGSKSSILKWFKGKKFDVITILEPEVGQWQVFGLPSSEGFATVLTNLKLVTDWPPSVIAGSKGLLQARLYESDKPVILPEMTGASSYGFQVVPTDRVSEPIIRELLNDEGEHGDRIRRDGIFSHDVTIEDPGEYRLEVIARAPTFERHQQIPFRVKPRLITVAVVSVEDAHSTLGHGQSVSREFFRVNLNPDVATMKKVVVKLVAIDDEHRIFNLPLARSSDKSLRYEVPIATLPRDGEYEVQASVTAESRRRDRVKGSSQVLHFTKVTKEIDEHQEVTVIAQEVKDEPEGPPPILPAAILITLLNLVVGGGCMFLLKKSQEQMVFAAPDFESNEGIHEILATLEERVQMTDVDLGDPRLTDQSIPEAPVREGPLPPAPEASAEASAEGAEEGDEEAAAADEGESDEAAAEDGAAEVPPPADEPEDAEAGGAEEEEAEPADDAEEEPESDEEEEKE